MGSNYVTEDLLEDIDKAIRPYIEEVVNNPMRGKRVWTRQIRRNIEIDHHYKSWARVLPHLDYLEVENTNVNSGSRFVIVEENL